MCNYTAPGRTPIGQWRHGTYFNSYEFFHYYMGSKYARELGYTGLYAASLVADNETGLLYSNKKKEYRELKTGRHRKTQDFISKKEEMASEKARFSDERWKEYVKDIVFFKKALGKGRWSGVLNDKGYNATPVWSTVVGMFFSNRFSTDSAAGMTFLALLDVLLLIAAIVCVMWAFGPRTTFLMVILIGTHYMTHYWHMKGALLRTDYAVCAVLGICMLKKEHYIAAGIFLAYSALSRIFPVILLFGIGSKLIWDFISTFKLDPKYIKFFAAYVATVIILCLGSLVYLGGTDIWKEYKEKIASHDKTVSPWRVGYKQIYMGKSSEKIKFEKDDSFLAKLSKRVGGVRLKSALYRENKGRFWIIQAVVLLLSFFCVKGLKDHDAVAYSFALIFSLVAATYYYYIILMIPVLFFAPRMDRPAWAAGLIMMLITAITGYGFYAIWRQKFQTYYWLSWMILIMCAYMMILAYIETWRARREKKGKPEVLEPAEACEAAE